MEPARQHTKPHDNTTESRHLGSDGHFVSSLPRDDPQVKLFPTEKLTFHGFVIIL